MRRYFIKFSYIGTQYRGLQINTVKLTNALVHDVDTVQGALEGAFKNLIPRCINNPKIKTSSRTDAGVHALCSAAHIDLENRHGVIYNPNEVLKAVNRYMVKCNHQIRLLEFIPVKQIFHARSYARSRTYLYRFMRAKDASNQRMPIMEKSHCYHLRSETFDIEKVEKATQLFMGLKDFTTFSARTITDRPINYVRRLNCLNVEKGHPLMPYDPLSENFEYWNIVCSSKSFLYNQVRRMVSALLALGVGKITEKDITTLLQVPGHHNWPSHIQLVPAHGLYLVNVAYDQEELDQSIIKIKLKSPDSTIVVPVDENDI